MQREQMEIIKPQSIKKNYILSLIYEVFSLLTPLITAPYISRVLGAEGVGIFSYTDSIAQYFIMIGNLGIATYGQMEVARCRDDNDKLSRTFFELWILRIITMVISLICYIIIAFSSKRYQTELLISGISILAAALDLTWLFRGIENFSLIVVRNFVVKVIMIFMIFTFVKQKSDILLYILFVSLSLFVGNLTFLMPLRKLINKVNYRELDILRHIRPCLIFFVPTIATSVYKLLDKTMLGILTEGTSQNGYYEQAHKIEQLLITVIMTLNTIMRSRMAYLFELKQFKEIRFRLDRSISFILMLAMPMTFGLIAVAPVFIPVFLGNGFQESIILLQIFALLLIFIGLSNCINTHFLAPAGRQKKNNYVLIGGAVINFACNLISIPRFGAVGAACSSVLAEAIILLGYLYLARDFIRIKDIFNLGWKYLIAGVVMFCCIQIFNLNMINPILQLMFKIIIGTVVYGIIILLIKDQYATCYLKQGIDRVVILFGKVRR